MWNVKTGAHDAYNKGDIDLIDTLWNVKLTVDESALTDWLRFNRYIVECKGEVGKGRKELED